MKCCAPADSVLFFSHETTVWVEISGSTSFFTISAPSSPIRLFAEAGKSAIPRPERTLNTSSTMLSLIEIRFGVKPACLQWFSKTA